MIFALFSGIFTMSGSNKDMKKSKIERRSLKDYLDFREYLRDFIQNSREDGKTLTNRSFAAALGIQSSSWLTTVMNGKKGITDKTVDAISSFLNHDEWEREYFKILVDFNQAKKIELRNAFFASLKQHLLKKGYYAVRVLETDQYEYYSKWYYSAVRSILGLVKIGDEFEKLARLVSPSITASQAKRSVRLLMKLGMIKKSDNGWYELTNQAITTGNNVRSLAVANFQRETMRLGCDAIDRYSRDARDISTLSVGISEEGFKKIQDIIAASRKAIVDIANHDENADRVYQVNFQVYPLSKVLKKKAGENESQ